MLAAAIGAGIALFFVEPDDEGQSDKGIAFAAALQYAYVLYVWATST